MMDLDARLVVAEEVARLAGALALRCFENREALTIEAKRNPQDMVSDADREVELLIREAIAERFPNDSFLGEEHGLQRGSSALTWIVDPIDGTAPFLAGLPGWCVSIGAADETGPAIGVVHAPALGETFAAVRGGQARLNGKPIHVTGRATLKDGLVGIGANDRVPAGRVGEALSGLMEDGGNWVRYGSGALMLAWVAAGRLVGYVEPRMCAWDCMAGYCLIQCAGGRVLPFPLEGREKEAAPVLGATPSAYDALLSLMRLNDETFWGAIDGPA